jgi:aldehyde dehydrogenase (NAD+)
LPKDDVMTEHYQMYIDGEWVPAHSGATFLSDDPWRQEPWARVPEGDRDDVERAVVAATRAFLASTWRYDTRLRVACLRTLAGLLDENAEALAALESRDNGKTIREERGMYRSMGGYFRYAANLLETAHDSVPHGLNPDVLALTRRVPYGVVGIQTPWNTPGVILAQSAASALAAGNTLVIKPSEQAPASTLEIAKLVHRSGFPPGVFNVVTGLGAVVGAALCTDPGVRKLVFTGSPEGGVLVAGQAAQRLVPVTMELGGKSANIVFADADLDAAALGIAQGFTAAAGQSCMCGSRALIEASVYDTVVDRVLDHVRKVRLGDPADPNTDLGPVCSAPQLARIEAYVAGGRSQGARLLTGGGRPEGLDHPLFYAPTVFADVTTDMAIWQEEVFGPVLALMPFEDEAEAIGANNSTDFGLSTGLWTRDLDRAHRVADALDSGIVWVNHYRRGDPAFPIGGMQRSGYGRVSGLEGFLEMSQPKSIQFLIARS